MTDADYRAYDAERDEAAVGPLLWQAFGGDAETSARWLGEVGDYSWVLTEDDRVQACLSLYPMGHWFAGRSVPALGVAGVAVDRTARGRGVGTRIMEEAVRQAHADGIALSSLYAAAQPIYRRVGFERAGHLYVVHADLARIRPLDRSLPIRPGTEDDEPALEGVERRRARDNDGNIDRSDIFWRRTRSPGGKAVETYVVEEDGEPTGYVRVRYVNGKEGVQLNLSDLVATTPGAARRLLAFLGDHASQMKRARWIGHPTEAVQSVADSLCFDVKVGDVWMLRLTHVESALAARGYPAGLTTELHLDLTDDLCPGNAGRWLLRIDDGAPTVERGAGEGRVRLDVRDLAPIYSGHQHPRAARTSRAVEASDVDLDALAAAFAGRAPWMQDAF